MFLASVACVALLAATAHAESDRGHGKDANAAHDGGHGRIYRAADTPTDNNAMRGHDQNNNGNRPSGAHNGRPDKNGWQGSNGRPNTGWQGNGRPNGWQGGRPNPGWAGNTNWRNDRAAWSRYHRSWTASRRYRWTGSYVRPAGWYYRRWTLGAFLPAMFFAQQYWIANYMVFALDPPPTGTVWVRYGSDALLVDRYSGEVIQVVYGIFY
jgi:Ni/Co efflux regulator RcnB